MYSIVFNVAGRWHVEVLWSELQTADSHMKQNIVKKKKSHGCMLLLFPAFVI